MIIDISVNLFISAIEFYLAYLFYNIFWERKQQLAVLDACAIGISAILLLLSSIPCFQTYATYLSIIAFFILGFLFEISILWKFIGLIILVVILSAGETIAASLLTLATDKTVSEISKQKLFYLSGKIFSKFICLFLLKIFEQMRRDRKLLNKRPEYILSLSLPLASCIIVWTLTYFFQYDNGFSISFMISLIYILLILSNIFLFDLLKRIYLSRLTQETLKIGERTLQHEEKYYLTFLEQRDEIIHTMRETHDIKNKLTAVLGLIEHNQIDNAVKIIEDIAKTDSEIGLCITGNVVLDAIINSKLKDIHTLDIDFSFDILFPDACVVEYQDLAIIAGNIFDNAIRACQEIADTRKRFIHFAVKQRQDYLCFKMENSAHFDERKSSIPSKTDFNLTHGIGLNNVKMISKKYNGNLKVAINKDKTIFSIIVILTNRI